MGIRKPKRPCILNPTTKLKQSMRKPVPPCEGPKLSRFPNSRRPIEFLNLISQPDINTHSHVFEVRIDGEIYALKMFHFYDPVADFHHLSGEQRHNLRHGDLLYHLDPFFVECRAYGKINARKETRNGDDLVVHAYGYLSLPATLEDKLAADYGIDEWNRPDDEYDKPRSRRPPFRAIIKKYVREDNVWNTRNSKVMLRDIKKLHKMGIYNMDVRGDNYAGNKLVDFSVSRTEPSLVFATLPPHQGKLLRELDLVMFDEMMEEEGVEKAERASPDLEYCRKLRSWKEDEIDY